MEDVNIQQVKYSKFLKVKKTLKYSRILICFLIFTTIYLKFKLDSEEHLSFEYKTMVKSYQNERHNEILNKEKLVDENEEMATFAYIISQNEPSKYCETSIYEKTINRDEYFKTLLNKDFVHNDYVLILINKNQQIIDLLKEECRFNST